MALNLNQNVWWWQYFAKNQKLEMDLLLLEVLYVIII